MVRNLVTYLSARLSNVPANVGASTTSFLLTAPKDSLTTRIFLTKTAFELARNPAANALSKHDTLYRLRQFRSKFHDVSSFFLCRSLSTFTNDHRCRPYTIFTYCDYDGGDTSSGKVASLLFKKIATSVISSESPVLGKQDVENCIQHCFDCSIKNICEAILQLFPENQQKLCILGNVALNQQLVKLTGVIANPSTRRMHASKKPSWMFLVIVSDAQLTTACISLQCIHIFTTRMLM